ncbi:lipase family alpha/beta hydrolase [Methylomicrobium lacus]|uniref:lipase family alpha/beta hydrolase n=1 Tax=Methylomicrobium lacus TaxID=136992 RepID=UPI0035A91F1D
MNKEDHYKQLVWNTWAERIKKSKYKTIFLHGIMGGELYDVADDNTRWIDLGVFGEVDSLEFSKLTPEGAVDLYGQSIISRSTISPPVLGDHYGDFFSDVGRGLFCYDWRDSIPLEAKRLCNFLRELLDQNGHNMQKVSFVTHSMGGCVLMNMLSNTAEFDNFIDKIIFCAPPFYGALKPIDVIEKGVGTPIDFLINNAALKRSAATMPGLFQLLPAHSGVWPSNPVNGINVKYPVAGETSLFYPDALMNNERKDLRQQILSSAWKYYDDLHKNIPKIISRLSNKINVIVGLNGKTAYMAKRYSGEWRLHTTETQSIPPGKISNGDGTVLFQSSTLPGLPKTQYWAHIPQTRENSHGGLVNVPNVREGILDLLNNQSPQTLQAFNQFSGDIYFGDEVAGATDPKPTQGLNYLERAKVRQVTPITHWGKKGLNPGGNDDHTFFLTRQAAYKVLAGESLTRAAERINCTPNFLREHIRDLLLPLL